MFGRGPYKYELGLKLSVDRRVPGWVTGYVRRFWQVYLDSLILIGSEYIAHTSLGKVNPVLTLHRMGVAYCGNTMFTRLLIFRPGECYNDKVTAVKIIAGRPRLPVAL